MLCISCAENLSLIPDSDGIGVKAKAPVTVYLVGVLTCRIVPCILLASRGKLASKTRSTIRTLRSIRYWFVWQSIANAVFFVLGRISKRYPTDSIVHGGIDTAANYKLICF